MNARLFSYIRRDGQAPLGLNIFVFIWLVASLGILVITGLILVKFNVSIQFVAAFWIFTISYTIAIVWYYRRTFKYYKIVRLKDIIYAMFERKKTVCNNFHFKKATIQNISIKKERKN